MLHSYLQYKCIQHNITQLLQYRIQHNVTQLSTNKCIQHNITQLYNTIQQCTIQMYKTYVTQLSTIQMCTT